MTIVLWALAALLLAALVYLGVQRAGQKGLWRRARRFLAEGAGSARHLDEVALAGLPAPAQRYLRRALPAGRPLARTAEIRFEQRVKIDKTDPASPFSVYRILEVLTAGRGMIGSGWTRGGAPKSVSFWYAQGRGQGREALFDWVPVLRTAGENVSRMLRGRAQYELFWLPSAFAPGPGVSWEAVDGERARVTVSLDGEDLTLTLRIDAEGRLREVVASRWGSTGTEGRGFMHIPFGMEVDEEKGFDGYTIPSHLRGGWWYGTDRYIESIHLRVDQACFS